MKTITSIADTLQGKRVLVRVGVNVPLTEAGDIADDFRLKRLLPTITFLREHGAKVLLVGHIGRKETDTLVPVFEYFKKLFSLQFLPSFEGDYVRHTLDGLHNGDVVLFENVRTDVRECANDTSFAQLFASFADIYVNEAFVDSHRMHASIVGIPQYIEGYIGLWFEQEVKELRELLNPAHPFLFIIGGSKFETKFPLVKKFLLIADTVYVGGALANDLFCEKGYMIGVSRLSHADLELGAVVHNDRVMLPSDVRIVRNENEIVADPESLEDKDQIVDAGPQTLKELESVIMSAKTILWNGPLGFYEKGYQEGTKALAEYISRADAYTVVGGGDTLASINSLNLYDKFNFVSTGGGAMLAFLSEGTLPGIEALK